MTTNEDDRERGRLLVEGDNLIEDQRPSAALVTT
jgi:hypothetical protein